MTVLEALSPETKASENRVYGPGVSMTVPLPGPAPPSKPKNDAPPPFGVSAGCEVESTARAIERVVDEHRVVHDVEDRLKAGGGAAAAGDAQGRSPGADAACHDASLIVDRCELPTDRPPRTERRCETAFAKPVDQTVQSPALSRWLLNRSSSPIPSGSAKPEQSRHPHAQSTPPPPQPSRIQDQPQEAA